MPRILRAARVQTFRVVLLCSATIRLLEDRRLLAGKFDGVPVVGSPSGKDDTLFAEFFVDGDDRLELVFVQHEGVEPQLDEEEQFVLRLPLPLLI